jgi:hypothetical protein
MRGTAADPARLATILFPLERLSDALAEGELANMGLPAAEAQLAALIHKSAIIRSPRRNAGLMNRTSGYILLAAVPRR